MSLPSVLYLWVFMPSMFCLLSCIYCSFPWHLWWTSYCRIAVAVSIGIFDSIEDSCLQSVMPFATYLYHCNDITKFFLLIWRLDSLNPLIQYTVWTVLKNTIFASLIVQTYTESFLSYKRLSTCCQRWKTGQSSLPCSKETPSGQSRWI